MAQCSLDKVSMMHCNQIVFEKAQKPNNRYNMHNMFIIQFYASCFSFFFLLEDILSFDCFSPIKSPPLPPLTLNVCFCCSLGRLGECFKHHGMLARWCSDLVSAGSSVLSKLRRLKYQKFKIR